MRYLSFKFFFGFFLYKNINFEWIFEWVDDFMFLMFLVSVLLLSKWCNKILLNIIVMCLGWIYVICKICLVENWFELFC